MESNENDCRDAEMELLRLNNFTERKLPIYMFSQFAGVAKGAANTAIALGSLLCPTLMGFMTTNHTRAEWNNFFIVISAMNIWSLIIYLKYGPGELQSWAMSSSMKKKSTDDFETNKNDKAVENHT